MGTWCRLAWRNIWRQKRRTALTLASIGLGLALLILIDSMVLGMRTRVVRMSTESMLGELQIHAPNYLVTGDPIYYLKDVSALLAEVRTNPSIEIASHRLIGPVMAAMGDRSAALTLLGVDFALEQQLTNWSTHLQEGTWPTEERDVLIGMKLAEKLEVAAGAKLVLTGSSLADGELESVLVHVSGVLRSEHGELNEYIVVSSLPLSEQLFGVQDAAHELIMRTKVDPSNEEALWAIVKQFEGPGREPIPWQSRMMGLMKGMKIQDLFMFIAYAVVFVIAALGIANTMGMSIMERIREFGVLQAIGTDPKDLALLVILEYTFLGLLGTSLGFLIGAGMSLITGHFGIPLSDLEVAGLVMNEPLHPVFRLGKALTLAGTFSAGIPLLAAVSVRRVNQLDPTTALRFLG